MASGYVGRSSTFASLYLTSLQSPPPCLFASRKWLTAVLTWTLFTSLTCGGRNVFTHGTSHVSEQTNTTVFPTLYDTLEMATLSALVYTFHREDYGNNDVNNTVCARINARSLDIDRPIPADVTCEWYHHDWTGGTQVMIVSSVKKSYVAVVFAGTDDLSTSLTDADILMAAFGGTTSETQSNRAYERVGSPLSTQRRMSEQSGTTKYPVYNVSLPDAPLVRVHAGFNHAVFDRNLFGEIVSRVEQIRCGSSTINDDHAASNVAAYSRLFTTGHSLGAANAVLTAVGFVQYYEQRRRGQATPGACCQGSSATSSSTCVGPSPVDHMTSINFGCPQTGNAAWRDYIHSNLILQQRLTIWRLVLGWDLVPRLPEFFNHVGHTVQLSNMHSLSKNQSVAAYFQHFGDPTLHLAGVPFGWSATPFLWLPGALNSHFMLRYCLYLNEWVNHTTSSSSSRADDNAWIRTFEHIGPPPDDDHGNRPPNVDDDFYVDPPSERDQSDV